MGRTTPQSGSSNLDRLGWMVVITIMATTAFWPALDGQFLNWDDDRNFLANPSYRGFGPEQWAWAWTTDHVGVWQPFAWMLLGLEHEIAGTDTDGIPRPFVYHAVSLGCHIINGWILFGLLASLIARARGTTHPSPSQVMAAGAVATLFTVHPLRVEAVAWISAQPYLPAIGFSYLSIWSYLQRFDERGEARPRSTALLVVSFLCFMIACGFKAVAVTTPLLLLIADFYPLGRHRVSPSMRSKRLLHILIEKLPYFAVAIFIAYIATWAKDVGQGKELPGLFSFDQRLAQASWGYCFYIIKTIVPIGLSPFYEVPVQFGLTTWPLVLGLPLVLMVTIACVAARRRAPYLLAAWLSYFLVLLPNSGIVQISQQLATDRYSYFALLGPSALLAAIFAWRLSQSQRQTATTFRTWLVILVAMSALIVLSRQHASRWRNSIALWSYAVDVDPHSPHARCQLGQAMIADLRFDEAIEQLERAVELAPDFAFAYSNLAVVQLETSQTDAAIENFNLALQYGSNFAESDLAKVHFGLAVAYFRNNQTREGLFHAKEASRLGFPPDRIADLMASF